MRRNKILPVGSPTFAEANEAFGPYGSIVNTIIMSATFVVVLVFSIWAGSTLSHQQGQIDALSPVIPIEPSCDNETGVTQRRRAAYQKRIDAALQHYADPVGCHLTNGDETDSAPVYYTQYSKGLAHDGLGHVAPTSYQKLITAAATGKSSDFDAVPIAGSLKLTNPQAGWGFVLEGADPQSFTIPPPPKFSSARMAGELVELYWMALLRDVKFSDYGTNPTAAQAIAELSTLSDYPGPPVTAQTLFRGSLPGVSNGPLVSQFLYLPFDMGASAVDQRINPYTPGVDFITSFAEYLNIQNGGTPTGTQTKTNSPVYITTGRHLARWVHMDLLFQGYLVADMILMSIGAPLKSGIPYQSSSLNQIGFGTWGNPFIQHATVRAAVAALETVWYTKWGLHRRLRPENYAARVHNMKRNAYTYPLHTDVLNSNGAALINSTFGTFLLPQAFAEGAPSHPSYGAGHATVAGACTTILKAFYQEDWVIPNPKVPDNAGTALVNYLGSPLTVGGELNKIASCVGIGRNHAGVHYSSDFEQSVRLGERIAIEILRDMLHLYNEPFGGFNFLDFDGNTVVVN